jgi:hypothetical protein
MTVKWARSNYNEIIVENGFVFFAGHSERQGVDSNFLDRKRVAEQGKHLESGHCITDVKKFLPGLVPYGNRQ